MPLVLDEDVFRSVVGDDTLEADEIQTVLRAAYVTAEIDLDEDIAERHALEDLSTALWRFADHAPEPIEVVSPIPLDDEERLWFIAQLATRLTRRPARELAYVVSYLLTASDLELAPIESRFLDQLQRALGIADESAADLVATAAEVATPGVSRSLDLSSREHRGA